MPIKFAFIPLASVHLAIMAIAGGMASAAMNTGIEDLLYSLIDKEDLNIRQTLAKSLITSFTVGLLLSVIYYAFAVYGLTESSLTPVRLIFYFTIFFGLGYPLIGVVIKLFYSRLLNEDV